MRGSFSLRRLEREELPAGTVELARYLIGKTLVHDSKRGRLSGRIVETEAYLVGDAAAHSFRGLTPRNRSLFLDRGHAYVYVAYGLHFMLNVSSESPDVGAGVLLRSIEPIAGIEIMKRIRHTKVLTDLARGPGRLAQAMDVDKRYDGIDLCAERVLWLADAIQPVGPVGESVRIGITKEAHRVLRFYERSNQFVSGPKALCL